MPGLCHVRDEQVRVTQLRNILETILDRDLRLVHKTSLPFQQLHDYCREIAIDPLQVLRPTSLKRRVRIQEVTQKHILYALEAVFLLRRIPIQGDYRGELFWFEDQSERGHFVPEATEDDSDWITLVYRNARAQFQYRTGELAEFFHYRTRGGAMVPMAVRARDGYLGVYPISRKSDLSLSLKRSAESFLTRYGRSKVLFVTRYGRESEILNDRIAVVLAQVALY